MLKKITASIIFAASLLSGTANAVQFPEIGNIYFFGDSLSDSGFNDLWPTIANPPAIPVLPTNKAPTFTTFSGYTWSQYVARDIKGIVLPIYPGPSPADFMTNNSCCVVPGFSSGTLTGFNYAAGGSTTNSTGVGEPWAPSLRTQVTTFLSQPGLVIRENDVFFIWEGANDILAVLGPATTELQLLSAADTAAQNIAQDVSRLASRGAKKFIILSLPNIGRSPLIGAFNDPALTAAIKNISFTFDGMLNRRLAEIGRFYPGLKWQYLNVYTLLDNVINTANAGGVYYVQGQAFYFNNTTTPACGPFVPAIYCTSGSNFHVFADELHPTDSAHRLLSLYVESKILEWKWQ